MGVEFKFNQNVEKLVVEGDEIKGVVVDGQVLTADRYVLAFGSYSRDFLKPLNLNLPVYPVKRLLTDHSNCRSCICTAVYGS